MATHSSSTPDTFDLVIVSNRLPYSAAPDPSQLRELDSSPGGLIAAMRPVMDSHPGAWVGWSGSASPTSPRYTVGTVEYSPVALGEEDIKAHYEGFSNQTIWPLYHDVGVGFEEREDWWHVHKAVSARFAEAAAAVASPGALVWVHDYQLQLVPGILRELRPDLTIGYFHHIPFPDAAVFSALSHREEVLSGLLGADLVGFQRTRDVEHFTQCLSRILEIHGAAGVVHIPGGREVLVAAHPISLDFAALAERSASADVKTRAARLREGWGNPERVFLGVDRLDYTKGIPERLRAFARALAEGELDPERDVFVQLASPSREAVSSYQEIRDEVESIVSETNSRFPSPTGGPVFYRSENVSRQDMLAHYLAADIMVVSALRDGMNLVAKEYVACRGDNTGVLVLSSHTGAADELVTALLVDPTDPEALRDALVRASQLSPHEQARAMEAMRDQVRSHDVQAWATGFLGQLDAI